ncbi:ATP-binding protein [Rouxiella sp. T17]|uniref:ATP-binding protein n=1 Tax=Rouxiella sp. T17 TaxID=3085684 RepID=UPI002FC894AF
MTTTTVKASPAKVFFVDMLTRDIELTDAILDLIDNCLDGAMRKTAIVQPADPNKKYAGYEAKITMDRECFTIEDNCGGIPVNVALNQAFRLGNSSFGDDRTLPTIGVYGIGMKRAMFKMGRHSEVQTKTDEDEYKVIVTPEWLKDDNDWDLPLSYGKHDLQQCGTKIVITKLRDSVSRLLNDVPVFQSDLINIISHHFAIVITKGFKIFLNGNIINPSLTSLMFDENSFGKANGITPYVYKNETNGVTIELAVGFYRDLSSDEEDESFLESRNTSEKAGWTIICNDRVVVYADKTRLTGWGESNVPGYHTQFIGIAGVVKFTSNDASLLPVTTTKRGIDGNSELYLAVKDYMRDGLKTFTSFTNKWKSFGNNNTVKSFSNKTVSASSSEISSLIPKTKWKNTTKAFGGQFYKPSLPVPKMETQAKTIKYIVDLKDFNIVAEYLFDNNKVSGNDLGKKTFEMVLREALENE